MKDAKILFGKKRKYEMKVPRNKSSTVLAVKRKRTQLIHRYYFFAAHLKMSYGHIVDILAEEFFLSQLTVSRCLNAHADDLRKMHESKIPVKQLKYTYPHINWEVSDYMYLFKK